MKTLKQTITLLLSLLLFGCHSDLNVIQEYAYENNLGKVENAHAYDFYLSPDRYDSIASFFNKELQLNNELTDTIKEYLDIVENDLNNPMLDDTCRFYAESYRNELYFDKELNEYEKKKDSVFIHWAETKKETISKTDLWCTRYIVQLQNKQTVFIDVSPNGYVIGCGNKPYNTQTDYDDEEFNYLWEHQYDILDKQ